MQGKALRVRKRSSAHLGGRVGCAQHLLHGRRVRGRRGGHVHGRQACQRHLGDAVDLLLLRSSRLPGISGLLLLSPGAGTRLMLACWSGELGCAPAAVPEALLRHARPSTGEPGELRLQAGRRRWTPASQQAGNVQTGSETRTRLWQPATLPIKALSLHRAPGGQPRQKCRAQKCIGLYQFALWFLPAKTGTAPAINVSFALPCCASCSEIF